MKKYFHLQKIIDEMPDEDFLDMSFFMNRDFDKDFDENVQEDFENPFTGEIVLFKCLNCQKISAYPIKIVNDIYEETTKEQKLFFLFYF